MLVNTASKLVSQEAIKAQDYSLTAGRYVGVETWKDNVNVDELVSEAKLELIELNSKSQELFAKIQKALGELF